MKLIVGLGNPGTKYLLTRHNVGFMAIDLVCTKLNNFNFKEGFKGLYLKINDCILFKPLTYMNLSGEAVSSIANFYKISSNDIIVIHDDLDLPVGKIRVRPKCASGGHNGIKSIFECLGNEDVRRIRIGIDKPVDHNTIDWVLTKFSEEELTIMKGSLTKVSEGIIDLINGKDFEFVMNLLNRG